MVFERVSESLLKDLSSEIQDESKATPKSSPTMKMQQNASPTPSPKLKGNGVFDLDAFMLKHCPDADGPRSYKDGGRIWVIPDCIIRPDDRNSLYVIQFVDGAISVGCQHDTCPWSKTSGNHWHDLREHFEGSTFMRQFPGNPNLDKELSTHPRTEYGLAERFRKRFGEHVRFIETWGGKWLVYNGRFWEQSDCAAGIHAQETINAIRREAWYLKDEDDEDQKEESQKGTSPVGDGVPAGGSDSESPEPGECSPQA
nr:hypothetical protein [uncultured Holophaga sp.]